MKPLVKKRKSLSTAITFLMVGLALTFTVFYSTIVLLYSWVIEDNIFNRQVEAEATYISQQYAQSRTVVSPRPGFMSLHPDWQGVPDSIVEGYQRKPSQIEYTLEDGSTVHFRLLQLGDRPYVLLADVAGFEVSRDYLPTTLSWLIGFAVTGALLVSLVAFVIARRMLRPIEQLARQVEELSIDKIAPGFSRPFPANEVGMLASTLEQSFLRLQAALQREVNFTRDVSHEIRTPISILKNVFEQHSAPVTLSEKQTAQVQRAIFELEKVTDTLLALARDESTRHAPVNMTVAIEHALLHHFPLNHSDKGQQLLLELVLEEQVYQRANANLVAILLDNLLSNIVQYATASEVAITLNQSGMTFTNQTEEAVPQDPHKAGVRSLGSPGIGQGLNLIERICQANHWQMHTRYDAPRFSVSIDFSSTDQL